jgi:hypothetical protein
LDHRFRFDKVLDVFDVPPGVKYERGSRRIHGNDMPDTATKYFAAGIVSKQRDKLRGSRLFSENWRCVILENRL